MQLAVVASVRRVIVWLFGTRVAKTKNSAARKYTHGEKKYRASCSVLRSVI